MNKAYLGLANEVRHAPNCQCSGSRCGQQACPETLENLTSASGSYCGYGARYNIVNLEEEATLWPKYPRWGPYERTVLNRSPQDREWTFKVFLKTLWEIFLDSVPFVGV